MKFLYFSTTILIVLCSCTKRPNGRSSALPDNVVSDKPIILKEGQALVLMKEGDSHLMVGASVINGKLSVSEIDPKGHIFGVTWEDSETWETTTELIDKEKHLWVMDKNMDGFPEFKVEHDSSGTRRFDLKGERWIEVKAQKNLSEQGASDKMSN